MFYSFYSKVLYDFHVQLLFYRSIFNIHHFSHEQQYSNDNFFVSNGYKIHAFTFLDIRMEIGMFLFFFFLSPQTGHTLKDLNQPKSPHVGIYYTELSILLFFRLDGK